MKKSFPLDSMARSISLSTRIEVLKNGINLFKIRDKGMRGINVYKRYVINDKIIIQTIVIDQNLI